MGKITGRLRRWVDTNLVGIGIAILVVSVALAVLLATYQEVGPLGRAPSNTFVILLLLASQFARALIYLGGFLIGVGVLLRNWRVVLAGFENTDLKEMIVDGPDGANTVWLGKRYASAFEAEAAFRALESRVTAEEANSREG